MITQPVTLYVPSSLYERFKQRAERAHRSIEAELLEAVATSAPATDEMSPDLVEAIASLAQLDDATLQRAAQSHFAGDKAAALEQLHLKRQAEGLTQDEARRASDLTREYERAMVIRAQAIALLMQRGYDVKNLLAANPE
jgi:hypothetical protein